jgi:hypothetical protein
MSETFPSAIPREQRAEASEAYPDRPRESSQNPGFPGPGQSATAPEKPKPHGSKILNKLDPRFDHDIFEEHQKETNDMTDGQADRSNR